MSLIEFPNPRTFSYAEWVIVGNYMYPAEGVVHFGGELTVDNLRNAYRKGIFPWFTDGIPLPWHCPEKRAVLIFDEMQVPRSLGKIRRRQEFTFTIDREFGEVMRQCASSPRPGQKGTWITGQFEEVYNELHREGMAHSVEVWSAAGELAGGLYGIDAGGVFCGESMFYREANASKLALLYLIDHLQERGATFLDTQVMTPHMEAFGARLVSRSRFLGMLRHEQAEKLVLFPT